MGGLLSTAFKNVLEQLIWLIMVFYVLSRGGGVELQIVNLLDETTLNTYMNLLVNSPNCLAAQEFNVFSVFDERENKLVSTYDLIINTKPGVVDLAKFYDDKYNSCLRYAGFWDQVEEPDNDGECKQNFTKVNNICFPTTADLSDKLKSQFLVYEMVLKDFNTGETHYMVSEEGRTKVLVNPHRVNPSLPPFKCGDAPCYNYTYTQFLMCDGLTTVAKKSITKPVTIVNSVQPFQEPHFGELNLTVCLGKYE